MPRICYASGKHTHSGNNRSHSMRATKRTFKPNILKKKLKLSNGEMLTIKISAKYYKKYRHLSDDDILMRIIRNRS